MGISDRNAYVPFWANRFVAFFFLLGFRVPTASMVFTRYIPNNTTTAVDLECTWYLLLSSKWPGVRIVVHTYNSCAYGINHRTRYIIAHQVSGARIR